MNTRHKIYFHKGKMPLSFIPLVLFGLIVFATLAVLGVFIGIVVGALAVGAILIRFLFSSKKKDSIRVEDNGRTIILTEDEYKVLEKK